jgi:undecaprenyl-diphosphatase
MPPGVDAAALRTRDAIALGLLHGPAELLPVSSSAHVALVPWLLGWPYASLDADLRKSFEVALHAGTLAALLVGLRAEVRAELRALDRPGLRRLALSTAVPALAGLAFERAIARRLGTPGAIALGLAIGAVALAAADVLGPRARRREDATDLDALALGLAQACALAPGVSRSGATLTAARARGFDRADATVLSLQAALPVIAGAAGLKGLRLLRDGLPAGAGPGLAAGTAASFLGSLAAIRAARAADRDRSLAPWAAYRVALAALVCGRLRAAERG